jgi:hypothetical protein
MTLNRQETEPYLSAFKHYQKNGAGSGPVWLKELRDSAITSFAKLGFPTTQDEDWKYTSVGSLAATAFEREEHSANDAKSVAADAIRTLPFVDSACHRLVFVNGVYLPELSGLHGLPVGARVKAWQTPCSVTMTFFRSLVSICSLPRAFVCRPQHGFHRGRCFSSYSQRRGS